jgi:aryl-alcohol dehydrogenase-like predicted oxidoreductase
MIQTVSLGSQGLQTSRQGLGCMGMSEFYGEADEAESVATIQRALELGVTLLDTADMYGPFTNERLVGRAIAGRRDEVLLFTKVAPDDEGSGIRPEQIHAAIRASLRRLGTDRVDLYQVHWPDDSVPLEETWGAMAQVVADGLAVRIGVSNFDRARIERCRAIHPVASVQNELSLLSQDDRAELLPWLSAEGIGYLAYSPIASGLLTGRYAADATFPENDWRRDEYPPERLADAVPRVERLSAIAERLGVTTAQLAVAWVTHQQGVTAAICGTLSAANARANSAAGEIELDAATLAEIDALF